MAEVGSVVTTISETPGGDGVRLFRYDWTSSAGGVVSGNALTLPAGTIVTVIFTPSAVNAPTALYDVDMLDRIGVSIFDDGSGTSIGANLSATLSKKTVPFIAGSSTTYVRGYLVGDTLYQLTVANAGAAKQGSVFVLVAPGLN